MPFAAFCKKCKCFMISEGLSKIRTQIHEHFTKFHDRFPEPNSYLLEWSAFEVIRAELDHNGRPFSFSTHRFCSDDYCIVVITENDYHDCTDIPSESKPEEVQKHLSLYLAPYFE